MCRLCLTDADFRAQSMIHKITALRTKALLKSSATAQTGHMKNHLLFESAAFFWAQLVWQCVLPHAASHFAPSLYRYCSLAIAYRSTSIRTGGGGGWDGSDDDDDFSDDSCASSWDEYYEEREEVYEEAAGNKLQEENEEEEEDDEMGFGLFDSEEEQKETKVSAIDQQ